MTLVAGWFGTCLQVLGLMLVALLLLKILMAVVRRLYVSVLAPAIGANTNLRKMGSWAGESNSRLLCEQSFLIEGYFGLSTVLICLGDTKIN